MEKEPDIHCRKIFMILTLDSKKTRFNELYRKLIKYNAKMSKPTLVKHLNHLIKDKVILRNQKDKQKVFYELNWKKFEHLQKGILIYQDLYGRIKDEEKFKSKSLQWQLNFTRVTLTIIQLVSLEMSIYSILEPKFKLENYYASKTVQDMYAIYLIWFYSSCKKSIEECQKLMPYIDKQIKDLIAAAFEPPQKEHNENQKIS
jgi:DNA-binding HxlR family transcriptional regulator